MQVTELADQCVQETGARRFGRAGHRVALIALSLVPDGRVDAARLRSTTTDEFRRTTSGYSSIFLVIVLPILVNLLVQWIIKWIAKRKAGSLADLRLQARHALLSTD